MNTVLQIIIKTETAPKDYLDNKQFYNGCDI